MKTACEHLSTFARGILILLLLILAVMGYLEITTTPEQRAALEVAEAAHGRQAEIDREKQP